jgi:hypothetical protein
MKTRVALPILSAIISLALSTCGFKPTPTPLPPTATFPPDARIIKIVSEGGKLGLPNGMPFVISAFTPEGKNALGISADLRNSKFDLSSVDEQLKSKLAVGAQFSSDHKIGITVSVDGTDLEFFYIDNNYLVYPPNIPVINKNGPFVRFVFYRLGADGKDEPLGNWGVRGEQAGREVSGKLSAGVFDLANVTLDPIHFTLTDPSTSKTYESSAFPKIRGAVKGLVIYMVWEVTGPK